MNLGTAVLLTTFGTPRVWAAAGGAPQEVTFDASDGGEICADLYGEGEHAVILAHGAVFDKQSWKELARALTDHGLQVLALDFRGYGRSTPGSEVGGLWLDLLGAAKFLRQRGVERVSAVGASMGAEALARASVEGPPGTFDRVILLAAPEIAQPERMQAGSFLFVVSRGDRLLPRVKRQFEQAPRPKRLEVLEGSAHAQHLFATEQAASLTQLIVDALTN
jgi:pimeloyl-ACP methyl ester carboxylesterase